MNHRDLRALERKGDGLADAMEAADNGNVVELARYRAEVAGGATVTALAPKRMDPSRAARLGQRMANVRDELMELQKELDAERERGCEDAGMYHVSLGFTVMEVDRVIADFVKEYGGE